MWKGVIKKWDTILEMWLPDGSQVEEKVKTKLVLLFYSFLSVILKSLGLHVFPCESSKVNGIEKS